MNRRLLVGLLASFFGGCGSSSVRPGATLSKSQAVEFAEKFVVENGYTDAPQDQVKANLDPESFNLPLSRDETIRMRMKSLRRQAIGVRSGQKGRPNGWSVAFDYATSNPNPEHCRVVTMDEDGSNAVVQHVDGIRSYFAGFD